MLVHARRGMRFAHMVLRMSQDAPGPALESAVCARIRGLRVANGWSLEELAARANLSASTVSRLETGKRRLTIEDLATIARALNSSVDALMHDPTEEEVVIRPRKDHAGGALVWLYQTPDDTSGRVVARMQIPASEELPEARVHPGRDWFYVLKGTVRLKLGTREMLVRAGQAASFDTTTPHTFGGYRGTAEILSIFDRHGERAHLAGGAS